MAELKDSRHDEQTRLLDEADAKIGSLEVALAALVGSTQFDRRGLQFLLHELKAVREVAKLSCAELDGRTAEVATLQSTVCGLQQQLAQVMRQAAEGEAAELATTLVEKMNIAETQQPDIQEALTVQHASMTGIQEGRETLDRAVSDVQAEGTAQHAVHRTVSDAQAYAHDLQQQVDRLQQELAKSEQRAEGDHASVQTLTAKVESLMGERMGLHREVFLLRQKLHDTAESAAERSRLDGRVVFLEHQLHAAKAAAASFSHQHQMTDGPSTSHSQAQEEDDWYTGRRNGYRSAHHSQEAKTSHASGCLPLHNTADAEEGSISSNANADSASWYMSHADTGVASMPRLSQTWAPGSLPTGSSEALYSTASVQDGHSREYEQDQHHLSQQRHQAWSNNDHTWDQQTGQQVPHFDNPAGAAGVFPAQQGLIQLPEISGFDPSVPLYYDTRELPGGGFWSCVYHAGCYDDMLQDQAPYAVIVYDAKNGWRCMMDQVATLQLLVGSPRLLQYCGHGFDHHQGFIVTELLPGLSLVDSLHEIYRQPCVGEAEFKQTLLSWTASVFLAVQEVHALGIAHRDIKLDNFCFKECPDDSSVLVLLDFRQSLRLHEGVGAAFAEFGTLPYMAPELLDQSSGYPAALPRSDHPVEDHQAVDVWAAACTAYSILTGLDLFSYVSGQPVVMQKAGVCRQQEALEVALEDPRYAEHAALEEMWKWGPEAVSFFLAMLCTPLTDRLTASQALEHPFLAPVVEQA